MKISIGPFKGQIPKINPVLLEDNISQVAFNNDLRSGALKGLKKPLNIIACVNTNVKSFFKYIEGESSYWIDSINILNSTRPPISDDIFERLYFTGEAQPRYFSNDNISTPFDPTTDYLKMGIPTPPSAPTFVSGHTGGSSYRAYVYTYVNRFGVEGPPSPVLETTTYNSGSIVIDGFTAPTAGHACDEDVGSNHPHVRLYRTNSSSSGVAAFQFVKEQDISSSTNWGTLSMTDDVADANLGEVIPSVNWDKPDADMVGLISLPNGIFAGFYSNTLCFSEPFLPEAWPTSYQISFNEQIIGIGYIGTNIVVCTDECPYLVYGSHPDNMAKKRLAGFYPCESRQGIVSTEYGVFYPSSVGIVLVDGNGVKNITNDILTKEDMTSYRPNLWRAGFYDGNYIAFYYLTSTDYGGVCLNIPDSIFYELGIHKGGTYLSYDDGKFYVVGKGTPSSSIEYIQEWEGDNYNYLQYKWKSKKFLFPKPINFSTAKISVDLDFYNTIITLIGDNEYLKDLNESLFALDLEGSFNGSELGSLDINGDTLYTVKDISITQYVTFKIYVDSVLKFTKQVDRTTVFRLPSGFKGRSWEVEIEGFTQVDNAAVASGMRELIYE